MLRYKVMLIIGVVSTGLLIGSCKKDDGTPTGSQGQTTPSLTAVPSGVVIGTNGTQDVTVTGGTHPYTAQLQNSSLASVQFVANADTAIIRITGVSTATGGTSIVVRDASTPTRSIAVNVTKTQ